MTLEVHLRDISTGAVKVVVDDSYPDDYPTGTIEFLWTDGNYVCDCNRSRFLYSDAGPACPCDSNRIVVDRVMVRKTGEVSCESEEWVDFFPESVPSISLDRTLADEKWRRGGLDTQARHGGAGTREGRRPISFGFNGL